MGDERRKKERMAGRSVGIYYFLPTNSGPFMFVEEWAYVMVLTTSSMRVFIVSMMGKGCARQRVCKRDFRSQHLSNNSNSMVSIKKKPSGC
jgi:hypothetical protein